MFTNDNNICFFLVGLQELCTLVAKFSDWASSIIDGIYLFREYMIVYTSNLLVNGRS